MSPICDIRKKIRINLGNLEDIQHGLKGTAEIIVGSY